VNPRPVPECRRASDRPGYAAAVVTVLLLIRHAESTANDRGLLTGWSPGVHLSDRGREQAKALSERLSAVPLAEIYASPLERCRETAAALASGRGIRVRLDRDLGEVRYGSWTGRPLKQLARTKLWKLVQLAPSRARFPDGESLSEAQQRVLDAAERIASRHPRRVVAVVSHCDPIRLLLSHLAGAHIDQFQRMVVDPASVSAVALGDGIPRILRVNHTGDLAGLVPRTRRVRG